MNWHVKKTRGIMAGIPLHIYFKLIMRDQIVPTRQVHALSAILTYSIPVKRGTVRAHFTTKAVQTGNSSYKIHAILFRQLGFGFVAIQ